jgi:nicotinamidase-related amidase
MTTGLQTNVCVETTARTAMMRNFEVAVAKVCYRKPDRDSRHFDARSEL